MARTYDNARRREIAEQTRHRVLEAARSLLLQEGYAAMTIAGLAAQAGVSPQTVYNSVGGKAEVVKAVYDVMLAGDEEPVPMSRRPEFRAMVESPDAETFLRSYAAMSRGIYERVGPLLGVLLAHGPAADATLTHFVSTIEQERRTGNGHTVTALRQRHGLPNGLSTQRAVDVIWTLTAPETADRLVRRCHWSHRAYQRWLGSQLIAALT